MSPAARNISIGDLVTYSNEVKTGVLGVSRGDAESARRGQRRMRARDGGRRSQTHGREHVAIATSGIAGPDGGTPNKPVGTVCIALSADDQSFTRRYQFRGTRDWIKMLTSQVALDWLRRYALGLPIGGEATIFAGRVACMTR